jgi:hypothetical protein
MKRVLSVLLLAGLMAADCGDSTEPTGGSIAGTWNLTTVNGASLPATITEDGETFTVTGGSAVVNANGNFTWSETYSGGGSDGVSGTWSAGSSANTYVFNPTETAGEPTQDNGIGTVSGNTMSLAIPNTTVVRVYTRQ